VHPGLLANSGEDKRPYLSREQVAQMFADSESVIRYEKIDDDIEELRQAVFKGMSSFPNYQLPLHFTIRKSAEVTCLATVATLAANFLWDRYLNKHLYHELINSTHTDFRSWTSKSTIELLKHSREHGKFDSLVVFFEGWLKEGMNELFNLRSFSSSDCDLLGIEEGEIRKKYQNIRTSLIAGFREAAEACERSGLEHQASKYRDRCEKLTANDLREKLPVALKIKVDIDSFWSILRECFDSGTTQEARSIALGKRLRELNVTGIRAFAKHYEKTVKKLSDHRAWDFATIVNGGCSDDSFLNFQESIIFLGRPELIDLIYVDTVAVVEKLLSIPGVELTTEYDMSSIIDDACIARAGSPIKWNHWFGDYRGEITEETDLPERYPQLVDWIDKNWEVWSNHAIHTD